MSARRTIEIIFSLVLAAALLLCVRGVRAAEPRSDAPGDKPLPSQSATASRPETSSAGDSPVRRTPTTAKNKKSARPAQALSGVDAKTIELVSLIDSQLQQDWSEQGIIPSESATDGQWFRRAFLDLIGRIPTLVEAERYLGDKRPDKRARLVDDLLSSSYADEYARAAATRWTNLLIGRAAAGRDRQGLVSREGLEQYLHAAFLENRPYDRLVYELISANGANQPESEGFNGAVNFLLDNLQDKGTSATAKTARIFLGVQVQCTQCHNHPFNNWKQQQFWGFNAFFRQARALRTFDGPQIISARLEDEDFAGESGDPETAEIYFERRDNTAVAILRPTFLDGTTIEPSGYVDDVNRRDELARLISKSAELPRAIVNRTWAHFLGFGFTKPIDDMGPHNPVLHAELLDRLSQEFVTAGFDLKQLSRWIVLSEPYALSSCSGPKNRDDDPSLGNPPRFSRFYLRQMRPEELYESLLVATKAANVDPAQRERDRREWLAQFATNFGTDENDEASTFNGTIPQVLMLMNGDLIRRATMSAPGTFLQEVASAAIADRDKVRTLYLAAVARPPGGDELVAAQKLWVAHGGDTTKALEDLWWALLNSNEFILNH
ncbi:MAG: DUF1549 and DUF1553 domain-containing protein [Pirellulales bacterium]|nr:DUF1549 and DUF1553 domain-containing protein [Pirellulales bacterium]